MIHPPTWCAGCFARAADNELVPITVLHRKGLALDGSPRRCFS